MESAYGYDLNLPPAFGDDLMVAPTSEDDRNVPPLWLRKVGIGRGRTKRGILIWFFFGRTRSGV